jgi:hypothetical protein
VKVGDLIKHRFTTKHESKIGIVVEVFRNGPPGFPVYVTAYWGSDDWWMDGRSIEEQYLEVVNESR